MFSNNDVVVFADSCFSISLLARQYQVLLDSEEETETRERQKNKREEGQWYIFSESNW